MSAPLDQPDWVNPQSGMAVTGMVLHNVVLTAGFSTQTFNLAAYSSLIITALPNSTPGQVQLNVVDDDTNQLIANLTTPLDNPAVELQPVVVPIQTQNVRIDNYGTNDVTLIVQASNRSTPRPGRLYQATELDAFFIPSAVQSGVLRMGYGFGSGPCSVMARVGGNTIKGLYHMVTAEGTTFVADTTEMHADSTNGLVVYKQWFMPVSQWFIEFAVTTSGTGSLSFNVTYG